MRDLHLRLAGFSLSILEFARGRGAAATLYGVIWILAAWIAPVGPVRADPSKFDGLEGKVEERTLSNGLRVLALEDHRSPVVSFQIWVGAGSRDETRFTGIAHLFEHMMFKGSENLPPEAHARLIGARGGQVNAFTTRDFTVYHEDITAESLPLVIDLEAERFANLDISAETLESERQVVLEERRMRSEDNPSGLAFEALGAITWTAHPYRWPVIGWRSDIEQVTVEACRAFFDTYYVPNNLLIVIVGDFETEPTLAHIERRFGALKKTAEIPRNLTREPEQRGERRATIRFDLRAPLLYAAWHAPGTGHEDAEALDVASKILSAGRSSRLYRALVHDSEKALYAHGGYVEYKDAGLFYAVAGARPDVPIEEVEALFFSEIERVAQHGVSEDEVEKAKHQLEVSMIDGLGSAHDRASHIGMETMMFGRVRPLDERLEAIQRVTPDDVQRVLQRYLVVSNRSVVRVVPPTAEGTTP